MREAGILLTIAGILGLLAPSFRWSLPFLQGVSDMSLWVAGSSFVILGIGMLLFLARDDA
jgi:hypothetical protein